MSNSSVTRTDIVVLAVVFVLLGCLLFPALAQSNSDSDKSVCLNRLKQLALAMLNHHDTRKSFPLASTQQIDHKPGSADAENAAGYSWLCQLLPFVEQPAIYDSLGKSIKAGKPAFDPELTARVGGKSVHPSAAVISTYICPGFKGDLHVSAGESDYQPQKDGALPSLSNYQGFAGSHFFNAEGLGRLNPTEQQNRAFEGDGAVPFPNLINGKLQKTGINIASIQDGTSNTIAIGETIEPAYSAWLDGQSTWLVAAWPGNKTIPTLQGSAANPAQQSLAWNEEDKKTAKVAVNLRSADGSPITYLANGRWSGSKERRYAASSNHPGAIGHAYVDGHVEMLSPDIDPNIYIPLVTRAGREIIPDEFKLQQAKNREQLKPKPEAMPKSGGATIELVAGQWHLGIDWSPLAIGDVRLRFPQILSSDEFRPNPTYQNALIHPVKSNVFEAIALDREKSEITLYVNEKESPTAAGPLFKQLRAALGEPTSKEVGKKPKRVIWRKEAKWADGAATFDFTLTEEVKDEAAANIVIHVTPAK